MSEQSDLVLRFELAGRPFGIRLSDVRELLAMAALTPVPGAELEGLLNLRGTAVPVFDLRAALRLPPRAADPADRLIVVQAGGRLLAVRADSVSDLAALQGEDAPAGEGWPRLHGALGVGRLADVFVFLPDLARLWSAEADVALSLEGGRRHELERR